MSTYQPVQVVSSTQETTPNLYPPHAAYHGLTNSAMSFDTKPGEDTQVSRTPSPTPSEAKELESGAVDWKALLTGKFWFRKEWLCTFSSSTFSKPCLGRWMDPGYYVALVVILVVSALVIIYHTQIVHWLTPFTKWLYGYVHVSYLSTMIFSNKPPGSSLVGWSQLASCSLFRSLP